MKGIFEKIKLADLIAYFAVTVGVIFAVVFLAGSISERDDSYEIRVMDYRQNKDKQFRSGEDSPIENKENFNGLSYYYPDPKYRVQAKITPLPDSQAVNIERNNGKSEAFLKVARAEFRLNGKEHTVVLLGKPNDMDHTTLFLPFTDQTTGKTTYGGGRYLDVDIPEDNKTVLDFNLAYNPYCVYNYRYSCPLPPKENFIDAEIKAGEKMYIE